MQLHRDTAPLVDRVEEFAPFPPRSANGWSCRSGEVGRVGEASSRKLRRVVRSLSPQVSCAS
jgi:hypothetical protein